MYEKVLEPLGAAEALSLVQEGCPDGRLTLTPYQQAQARPSMGAEGLRLPSIEARRVSASIGSRVGTLPEVLAGLTDPQGGIVRRGLPESSILTHLPGII